LAVTNAKSEAVRKFGQMMVDEHKKANEKLMEVAQKAGLTVTAKPTAEHQKCLDKLKDLKGAEFDKEYMTEQVKGHEIAVREFKRAKAEATDSGVKDFASKSLSTLEKHLDIAKKILADGK
jgi:putative membrane protein